jgi:hypothetical protein
LDQPGATIRLSLCRPALNRDVLSIAPAEGAHAVQKGPGLVRLRLGTHHIGQRGVVEEKRDPGSLPFRLRVGRKRRSEENRTCASKERAPVHHWALLQDSVGV